MFVKIVCAVKLCEIIYLFFFTVNNAHTIQGSSGPTTEGNVSNNNRPATAGAKDQKPRSNKPPPSRRSESKHKELVNGTTA